MGIIYERNNALVDNPQPTQGAHLTESGSSWLFAVTAIFLLCFFVYFALSFKPNQGERIFHYLFTIALLTGGIAYYAMGSGLAWSVVATSSNRGRAFAYQIFFAKYIHWVVSFPVIILALGLVSGVSWATILFNIFLSWIWIISYLCGAYTQTDYKWGFFVFGTLAWILLAVQTLHFGRTSAGRFTAGRDYLMLAGWVNLIWFLYPIAWGLSDGGNRIGVTQSLVFFGILDLLLVVGLAFAFLFFSRKWDYGNLNLHFTQYGRVPAGNGTFPEKSHHGATGTPATGTAAPMTGTTAPTTTATPAAGHQVV